MTKSNQKKSSSSPSHRPRQYMILYYDLVHSETWRGLSGRAVKVWIEIRSRHNGRNNGKLHLGVEEAAKLLHMSKSTASRAYKELVDKGLLRKVRSANRGEGKAAEYECMNLET